MRAMCRAVSPVTEGELPRSVAKGDKARYRTSRAVDCPLRILPAG